MAMNGTDVLLLVNTGTEVAPVYQAVGSQRGLTRNENIAEIDVSSKDSAYKRVFAGRYSSGGTLDGLYVPDHDSMLSLVSAVRNRELLLMRISEQGTEIEEATVLVTTKAESFPDQAEATVNFSFTVDGEWAVVGS